jgi:hypothetical protein
MLEELEGLENLFRLHWRCIELVRLKGDSRSVIIMTTRIVTIRVIVGFAHGVCWPFERKKKKKKFGGNHPHQSCTRLAAKLVLALKAAFSGLRAVLLANG